MHALLAKTKLGVAANMPKHLKTIAKIAAVVVIACTLFLFFSGLRHEHTLTYAAMCKVNLHAIEVAKANWARDEHKTTNDTPNWSDLVGTNRYLNFYPECPSGGIRALGRVGEPPNCSIHGHPL